MEDEQTEDERLSFIIKRKEKKEIGAIYAFLPIKFINSSTVSRLLKDFFRIVPFHRLQLLIGRA